jgi:hypothetical protein
MRRSRAAHYCWRSKRALWTSRRAKLERGRAIEGGMPEGQEPFVEPRDTGRSLAAARNATLRRVFSLRSLRVPAAGAIAAFLLAGCSTEREERARAKALDPLETELAQAFRVDLSELEIAFDYRPADSRIEGSAVLRFEMRPGQSRPVFHFNPLRRAAPAREREMLRSLELDGEPLDPSDDADLRLIRTRPSAEPAFEVQRDLVRGAEHTLRASWSIPAPGAPPGRFYATFDDTVGPDDETETLWPTVSSPEEFARHRIRLRVHSRRPYTVLGSGVVRRRKAANAQAWDVDTGRPIASHTVFLAAVPSRDVRTERFTAAGGVHVSIVSDRPPAIAERARAITRRTIARLVDELGPFPMSRMQILLTGWAGGMEYYGATRTGIGALEHELVHMYFGAATVNRTWRDTWIDEAAVEWWQRRDRLPRLPTRFRSELAGGRTAVAPGFDVAAYEAGARILGEIARALGGKRRMIAFLADLHRRRAFVPFTTDELIDDVVAAQEAIGRAKLERWLYSSR